MERVPLPTKLQVEVTAACNLRCKMCLVRYRPPVDRVSGSMSLDLFRALLDDLPTVTDVTLQGLGEPLLAPDLLAMVELAKSRSLTVGFNTNATLLTERRARELVRSGLDWICVSLDGATAGTYESIRDGARLDRVVRNLRTLLTVKREHASATPHVRLVFVAMRSNLAELGDVVRLAAEVGADSLSVQNLSHTFDDTASDSAYAGIAGFARGEALWTETSDRDAVESAFSAAVRLGDALGVPVHVPHVDERPPASGDEPRCDWPWTAAYVAHDGIVQPCCMVMGEERATMGDARDGGIARVWNDEPLARFRQALRTDTPPDVCHGCAYYRGVF